MELPEIILSFAVIAVGVGAIAYILLRRPKAPARIGSEGEATLGDEVTDEVGEETDAPAEETPAEEIEKTEENADA